MDDSHLQETINKILTGSRVSAVLPLPVWQRAGRSHLSASLIQNQNIACQTLQLLLYQSSTGIAGAITHTCFLDGVVFASLDCLMLFMLHPTYGLPL